MFVSKGSISFFFEGLYVACHAGSICLEVFTDLTVSSSLAVDAGGSGGR